MKTKPVVPRQVAVNDVDAAVDYYLGEAGTSAALGFIDSLQRAYAQLSRHPRIGSPRYASELGLPELRCWPLRTYPHLIFYVETQELIDVWRVLHANREIPPTLYEVT